MKRMRVIHSWPWYWLVWPWWGGRMYRIVTGVTSDIGVPSTYLVLKMFWFVQEWKLQTRDGSLVKDRVWQVYDMIIMPGLLCPAVPHGWREVGGSAAWRHPTCNVKVSLKDYFFIGTPERSSLSHGHVHMLSLCTDFCSGFDIFMYFLTASSAILLQVTIWIRVRITYARFWPSFTLEFIVFCDFFPVLM